MSVDLVTSIANGLAALQVTENPTVARRIKTWLDSGGFDELKRELRAFLKLQLFTGGYQPPATIQYVQGSFITPPRTTHNTRLVRPLPPIRDPTPSSTGFLLDPLRPFTVTVALPTTLPTPGLSGIQELQIPVTEGATVLNLKEHIERETGYPVDEQTLVFDLPIPDYLPEGVGGGSYTPVQLKDNDAFVPSWLLADQPPILLFLTSSMST